MYKNESVKEYPHILHMHVSWNLMQIHCSKQSEDRWYEQSVVNFETEGIKYIAW